MSAKKPKRPRTAQPTQPQTAPAVRPSASPQLWLLFAGLVLLTLAVYYPAWHGGMLWDDDAHITRVDLRSLSGLWRIWFDVGATQQYYPAAHSAFWVFYQLWGDNTLGYHLANIVLHASSAFLVAVILRRLAIPGAVLAALIFAVHPVNVESVAWMTELKNTLSGVCYLGAALMYLRFDESRDRRWYALAAGLFVLALFSKTVTATLPAALLVIFWWQRGRIRWREDVVPLLPFFAIGVAGGLLTAWVERAQIGAEGPAFQFTFVERCLIAGRAFWFYLGKLVWPTDLMFIYPRWQVSQQVVWQYAYPIALVALVAALWWYRTRSRAPLAAVLFFAGTLFPALGFFNVYPFIYSFVADHFQYLASLGIIVLASAAAATLAARWLTVVVGRDCRSARAPRDEPEPPVRGCRDAVSDDAQPESGVLDGVHQSRQAPAGGSAGAGRRPAAARGGRERFSRGAAARAQHLAGAQQPRDRAADARQARRGPGRVSGRVEAAARRSGSAVQPRARPAEDGSIRGGARGDQRGAGGQTQSAWRAPGARRRAAVARPRSTRRSRSTTRRCASSRATPRRTTTWAARWAGAAAWTRRSRSIWPRSRSIRGRRGRAPTSGSRCCGWAAWTRR